VATLLHIAHYSGRKIRSVATHTTTYNDTLKIITVNTVYTINLVVQNPVAINNNIYILLQHLTEIITINTAHITNPVAFTSVAIHNVTYCYSTSQTPSQLIQHTSPTRSPSLWSQYTMLHTITVPY